MHDFIASHLWIGALIYSWRSFEIGRGAHKGDRQTGAILSTVQGVFVGITGLGTAIMQQQWIGVALMATTLGYQGARMRSLSVKRRGHAKQ